MTNFADRFRRTAASPRTWLVAILLLGTLLRAYRLGDVPPGMNQDEASTAYDAFAIAFYGIDRNGYSFPLFLTSWGNGMLALPAYVLIPFYFVLGPTLFATRVAAAACGIASIALAYGIGSLLLSKRQGLVTAFFVAVSPWHVLQSRWFFEAAFFPFLFLAAFYAQLHYWRTGESRALFASAAFFALTLYTYGPAFLVVPLVYALSTAYIVYLTPSRWRTALGSIAVFATLAIPFVYYIGINSFGFPEINTFFSIPDLPSMPRYRSVLETFALEQAAGRLLALWGMLYWQTDGLLYNAIPRFGILYHGAFLLSLAGVCAATYLLFFKKQQGMAFIFLWLTCSFVLGVVLDSNINRLNIAVLLLVFFVSIAVGTFARHLFVLIPVIALYLVFTSQFALYVFRSYPDEIGPQFFESFNEAVALLPKDTGAVCITDRVNMPYIFVLFERQVNPRSFVSTVKYDDPHAEFRHVRSFGQYTFGFEHCDPITTEYYVLRYDEVNQIVASLKYIGQRGDYVVLTKN